MAELFEIKDMKCELRNGMNLRLNLPRTSTYGIDSLSYLSANIWTHVSLEIKQCKTLSLYKQNIKTWTPEVCPCKLCKTYIHNVGYYEAKCIYISCILINYYFILHNYMFNSIDLLGYICEFYYVRF